MEWANIVKYDTSYKITFLKNSYLQQSHIEMLNSAPKHSPSA